MSIDSLGKAGSVPKAAPAADHKEGQEASKVAEGSTASRVDLGAHRFEGAIQAETKKLSAADEAQLAGIRRQVASGEYILDPADIARSIMEDRAFFAALNTDKD